MTQRWHRVVIGLAGAVLLADGLWRVGEAALIQAKAWIAPVLIEKAWVRALAGETGAAIKPWPWADTVPALKLTFPQNGQTLHVLEGASARAMAFGPTLHNETATPVLFGHRDTHFAFLETVSPGETLRLERADGTHASYSIIEATVRHEDRIVVPVGSKDEYLALVTCYPFDATEAGGPLRYVLLAKREEPI